MAAPNCFFRNGRAVRFGSFSNGFKLLVAEMMGSRVQVLQTSMAVDVFQ
jgi:hypothetical protein